VHYNASADALSRIEVYTLDDGVSLVVDFRAFMAIVPIIVSLAKPFTPVYARKDMEKLEKVLHVMWLD